MHEETLPLPSTHKGGFMYARESVGLLNGIPLSRMEFWTKPDKYEIARVEEARNSALSALSTARDGSVYEYRQACIVDDWIEERTFNKVNGEWVLIHALSYP